MLEPMYSNADRHKLSPASMVMVQCTIMVGLLYVLFWK
jgi:hypothetical protein